MPKIQQKSNHGKQVNNGRSRKGQDTDGVKILPKETEKMSNLNNLIDAARIVESNDSPKVSKKSKGKTGKVKEPQKIKKRSRGVKNGKPAAKLKNRESTDEASEQNSDSESDRENEIASIKHTMSVMMAKLEKLEGAKKKQKTRKSKKVYSSDDDDDEDLIKPSKVSKKDTDSIQPRSKSVTESPVPVAGNYNMNNLPYLHQYQQMMMMQQQIGLMSNIYPPFMVPPLGMVPARLGATKNAVTSASLLPATTLTKSSHRDVSSEFSNSPPVDKYVGKVKSVPKVTWKNTSDTNENSNDGACESDASEVYEPTKGEVCEPSKGIDYIYAGGNQPSKSFLGFVDEINKDESIQSMVVSSTKRNFGSGKDKRAKTTGKVVKEEDRKPTFEKSKSIVDDVPPNSNVAGILINLMPQKKSNTTKVEPDEQHRPVINNTLKALFGHHHQSIESKPFNKLDLQRSASLEKQASQRSADKLPRPDREAECGRYVDNTAWLRDCTQNLYLQDQDGDTILHILIAKEEETKAIEVIKRMKGFRLDILNALGQTPLHLAMYTKSIKVAETLLQHGADVSIVDAHGNSPLHIACEEDSLEMLEVLFEYGRSERSGNIMQIRNNQGIAAIHIATIQNNLDVLKFLVRHRVDLNIQESRSGNTPLLMALRKNDWRLAHYFMDCKANVNIPNFSGCYPLHLAVQGNNKEMVELLLHNGAETGSKANDYENNSSAEIKSLLVKAMRKRRRNKQRQENV